MSAAPAEVKLPETDDDQAADRPWIVIVWNDPINLMSYVVLVFQKLFGYNREKATELMLDVHQKGRAVVSSGTREKAELDVFRLHDPLNDVSNLREAAEAIVAADRDFEAGLVYSPGPTGEVDTLIERAKMLPDLGAVRDLLHDHDFRSPVIVQCLATAGFFVYIGGSSFVLQD